MTVESHRDRTSMAPDDEPETDAHVVTRGGEPRTWIVVGLVFLALFVAIFGWAIIHPIT